MDLFREISDTLQNEKGMPGTGVAIWPRGEKVGENYHLCSVAEFLSKVENQKGTWCIDGGWGGPPGPIVVRWNEQGYWENGGFCGHLFKDSK